MREPLVGSPSGIPNRGDVPASGGGGNLLSNVLGFRNVLKAWRAKREAVRKAEEADRRALRERADALDEIEPVIETTRGDGR